MIKDKLTTFIDPKAKLGENVIVYENVRIEGLCEIADNATIFPNSYISNSKIGKGTKIYSSFIENSEVGACVSVGPYAHLRPNCKIGDHAKIGNFCEIKNSVIGARTKVCHLAYVGDTTIGKNCNIGCGVVFANFDGKVKHRSEVGDGAFVGCNANIVAPAKIGEGAYVCAGTTITGKVEAEDFVIGRVRATSKPRGATKYLPTKK